MLQTKALYNLIRLNAKEDPKFSAEKWALEDLRPLEMKTLFERLKKHGIAIDKEAFFQFAEQCDTPEELADLLLEDEADEKKWDLAYLVLFELWRRLLPEKQSLSIFCDELDQRISLYDQDALENDEPVQDSLANLLEILEENTDSGADPKEVFKAISNYCAHDVESFLYDYISEQLDNNNPYYASELTEGFAPFAQEPIWFDFLKARLVSVTDIGEANTLIHEILDLEPEFPLLMETLQFLAGSGEHDLFITAIKKILPQLKAEEEFLEVMETVADYYRRLDEDKLEQAIQKLLKGRKKASGKLNPSDPDLKKLRELITK